MINNHTYTEKQIAEAIGITQKSIRKRSIKGNWPYTEEICRGGKRRLYKLSDLPGDTALVLTGQKINVLHEELAELDILLDQTVETIRSIKRKLRRFK